MIIAALNLTQRSYFSCDIPKNKNYINLRKSLQSTLKLWCKYVMYIILFKLQNFIKYFKQSLIHYCIHVLKYSDTDRDESKCLSLVFGYLYHNYSIIIFFIFCITHSYSKKLYSALFSLQLALSQFFSKCCWNVYAQFRSFYMGRNIKRALNQNDAGC